MKLARTLTLTALLAVLAASATGQVPAPILSGYNRLALPGNSDSIVALPFARPETAAGLVLSFAANRITFQGAPGWQAGQFVFAPPQTDTFYVLIGSGTREGAAFTVTGNGANFVDVQLDGDTLAGLTSGDRVAIIPYWTLATLFPNGQGVHPSPTLDNRPTEVLFPNFNAPGINSSAARTFCFHAGHWLEIGFGLAEHDHEVLLPDAYFTVRHNIATATDLHCSGQVLPGKLTSVLGVNAAGKRDNFLGLQRPVNVTLAASGLVASGAFAASPTPGSRTDELLIFDNALVRKNKSASAIYYWWNGAWRKVGAGTASFDAAAVFTPGTGFIIRKNLSTTAPAWTNQPNY